MVSFFAGICEVCHEPNTLATPAECKAAGLTVDVAICVACLRRMNPAAAATIQIGNVDEKSVDAIAKGPLVAPGTKPN